MSMLNAAASYRREDRSALRVPVVMPLIDVRVDMEGLLTVTVDREPYSTVGALQRDDLKRVLDDIAADLGTPIRVEVQEADDSTFTDIVTPEPPNLRVLKPTQQPSTSVGEVAGEGFLPLEEVAIAVIVAHQSANSDGTARFRLPPALLEAQSVRVVLMGQKSGTVTVSGGSV
jgi:hypothetical protein